MYASPPTSALGRLAVLDWIAQRSNDEDNGLVPPEKVARSPEAETAAKTPAPWKISRQQAVHAFDRITTLRFNSPSLLAGQNAPLTLLAARAGHTIGGTLWTLRSPTSDDVVYAPIWNHLKEKTVDGATTITTAAGTVNRQRKRGLIFIGTDRSQTITPKLKARNTALLGERLSSMSRSPVDAMQLFLDPVRAASLAGLAADSSLFPLGRARHDYTRSAAIRPHPLRCLRSCHRTPRPPLPTLGFLRFTLRPLLCRCFRQSSTSGHVKPARLLRQQRHDRRSDTGFSLAKVRPSDLL